MAKGRKAKSTYDKLKELDPQFLEATESLDVEHLDAKIVELTKYQLQVTEAKKEDPDLQRILEEKRTAEEGYRQSLGGNRLKIKYIVELLKSKGK